MQAEKHLQFRLFPIEMQVLTGRILHLNKKRADASTLFRCRPKASTAIDFILVDLLSLSTVTSVSEDLQAEAP